MNPHRWQVPQRQKLIAFLQEKVGGTGKGLRRLLEQNSCKINGRIERFGSVWVDKGSIVEFVETKPVEASWAILFENEALKIVDKPAGWVCDDAHCRAMFGPGVFLVHRLDKDTTGALLLAKNRAVRDELMNLFAERLVQKEYLAIVDGIVREDAGVIENFLAKKGSFQGQTIWGAASRGERAITHWKVLARGDAATLLSCQPLTGRTHQIRVHLAGMKHPILIDRQYAERFRSSLFAARPLLHAHRLAFTYQGHEIAVVCDLPADFKEALLTGLCPFLGAAFSSSCHQL